jgi:hypothetical protein
MLNSLVTTWVTKMSRELTWLAVVGLLLLTSCPLVDCYVLRVLTDARL